MELQIIPVGDIVGGVDTVVVIVPTPIKGVDDAITDISGCAVDSTEPEDNFRILVTSDSTIDREAVTNLGEDCTTVDCTTGISVDCTALENNDEVV